MWKPMPKTVRASDGSAIEFYSEVVNEPAGAETNGQSISLLYTPRGSTNERYISGVAAGPTGRCRVDISTNGGGAWAPATGTAVGAAGVQQTILVRFVALPYAGDDSQATSFGFGVAASGEASYLA